MTKGFYQLTSGMLSQSRRLDTVAGNLTNLSTPGYKKDLYTDRTFGEVLLSRTGNKDKSGSTEIGGTSWILAPDEPEIELGQGAVEETGGNLDFAIQGEGYFAIQTESGVAYTRNGSFSLDGAGCLTLPGHSRVLGADGQPLFLPTDEIRADDRGNLFSSDGEALGTVGVFGFGAPEALVKRTDGLFAPAGQAAARVDSQVLWRSLESSNVDLVQEMSQLMTAQRAFQSAAQVLKLYDGVLTKAATEIGRL